MRSRDPPAGRRRPGIRHGADRGALTNIPYADAPADFRLVVSDPGSVEVTSTLEGELFDRVALRFERPETLAVTPLVALGDGWIADTELTVGERISVANLDTNKVIQARVMDPQTVKIDF